MESVRSKRETKDCTFKPQLVTKSPSSKSPSPHKKKNNVFEKLHSHVLEKNATLMRKQSEQ